MMIKLIMMTIPPRTSSAGQLIMIKPITITMPPKTLPIGQSTKIKLIMMTPPPKILPTSQPAIIKAIIWAPIVTQPVAGPFSVAQPVAEQSGMNTLPTPKTQKPEIIMDDEDLPIELLQEIYDTGLEMTGSVTTEKKVKLDDEEMMKTKGK